MPKTRPAPSPVRVARTCPRLRWPVCTAMNAIPAMTAAAGQCENEPNDRPMGLVEREIDSSATPVHRTTAPATSDHLTACRDIGTARTSANTEHPDGASYIRETIFDGRYLLAGELT